MPSSPPAPAPAPSPSPLHPSPKSKPTNSEDGEPTTKSRPNPSNISKIRDKKKIQNLRSKISILETQIVASETELAELTAKLKNPNPSETVNRHIRLLHEYNEIRDVGQGLMGLIADARGERMGVIMGEFGMGEKD